VRSDVLEPLAILDSKYPPSLELTDILEDREAIAAVPPDEVLPLSSATSTGAATSLSNTVTATTATAPSPLAATTALALTDSKK